jgi:hypothetical protein
MVLHNNSNKKKVKLVFVVVCSQVLVEKDERNPKIKFLEWWVHTALDLSVPRLKLNNGSIQSFRVLPDGDPFV